jgi:hypothetical protein
LENRPFSLSCLADASPPIAYQWVKDGGDISGANSPTYSIARAQDTDGGEYYCRVSNPVGSTNSRTATVTVIEDEVAPLALGAIAGDFTSVTVQFNEAMDPLTTVDTFSWGITDGVNSPSISAINVSADGTIATVVLEAGTPLAEDTLYTLSILAGPADLAGNVMSDTNLNFRSFVTAGCSGFLFETYGPLSTTVNNINTTLKADPSFPDNPREPAIRMPSFDARHAYPDDSHEGYGARIRGLFVPTVSGPWTGWTGVLCRSDLQRRHRR